MQQEYIAVIAKHLAKTSISSVLDEELQGLLKHCDPDDDEKEAHEMFEAERQVQKDRMSIDKEHIAMKAEIQPL